MSRGARWLRGALAPVLLVAAPLAAQPPGGGCRVSGPLAPNDLCQKAADLFAFLAPQAGAAVAGGNLLPGEGGTLGGWGKRSVSVRVVAAEAWSPRDAVPLTAGTTVVASDFGAQRVALPVPTVDLALGLTPGLPMGLTNVGGIDLLAGATVMPAVDRPFLRLAPSSGGLGFGYGVRVGLLQESAAVPGLALSWMRRRLPTFGATYRPADDSLQLSDAAIVARSLRLTASTRFGLVGVAAGLGQDHLDASAGAAGVVRASAGGVETRAEVDIPSLRDRSTRRTAFLNLGVGRPIARLVLEVGWSSSGSVRETINQFGDREAGGGTRYASLGFGGRF